MLSKFNPDKIKYLGLFDRFTKIMFHTGKRTEEIRWKNVKKIILVDFTNIGDLIMLIPALKILKINAPTARITLVCASWGEEVLGDQGLVDTFYLYEGEKYLRDPYRMIKNNKRMRRIVKQINCTDYDVALEPRGDLRYIFFMHFIHAGRKISYDYTGGTSMLTDIISPSPHVRHLMEDKLYFLRKIGCEYQQDDIWPALRVGPDDRLKNEKFVEQSGLAGSYLIGIHPGASMRIKEWDRYSELMIKLQESYPKVKFLVFEGPLERKCVDSIEEALFKCRDRFFRIKEKLHDYMRILSLCNLVICNDSAAGHIAAAYKIPVLVLFGPVEPEYAKPVGKNTVLTISKKLDCKPCRSTECRDHSYKCIRDISVAEVLSAAEEILKRDGVREVGE